MAACNYNWPINCLIWKLRHAVIGQAASQENRTGMNTSYGNWIFASPYVMRFNVSDL